MRTTIRQLSTSTTITVKPTPSKSHLYSPLSSEHLPKGFLLAGVPAGVKKQRPGLPAPLDLALIVATTARAPAAAACFTLNAFRAAPVLVSLDVLAQTYGRARAVVINSGCANAVTGNQGMADAWSMVRSGDALLRAHGLLPATRTSTADSSDNESAPSTLVMSTGVIGVPLPITRICSAIDGQCIPTAPGYALTGMPSAYEAAARAFMTTDTFPKVRARAFELAGRTFRMAGIDKGAGMIHPRMAAPDAPAGLHATLLGLILTDAPLSPRSLQRALSYAVDRSFNSISVDGDMSTNDSIYLLANGAGAADSMDEIDEETHPEEYRTFRDELTSFSIDLAKLVVRDGEGATKFVEVSVEVGCLRLLRNVY